MKHPPKILYGVVGFFALHALMGRLRSGRWIDSILLSLITTALLIFVIASVYVLVTRPGYRLW